MFKNTADILDYTLDFTDWLRGDTILTATFSVPSTSGLSITQQTKTDTHATVWLSGGNKGSHKVNCTITTAQGRTKRQAMVMEVSS